MYLRTCKTPARLEPVASPNDQLAAGFATSRTPLPCPAVPYDCGTSRLRRRDRPARGLAVCRGKLAVLDNWRGWGLRNNLGDTGLSPAAIATQMSGVGVSWHAPIGAATTATLACGAWNAQAAARGMARDLSDTGSARRMGGGTSALLKSHRCESVSVSLALRLQTWGVAPPPRPVSGPVRP